MARPPLTARTADRHDLYERAVQDTRVDIGLIEQIFSFERARPPLHLREDFCGTAKLCADWVRDHPQRRALGVDHDAAILARAGRRHLEGLGEACARVRLVCQDVRAGAGGGLDVIVAFNFSYMVLKKRRELLEYFRAARHDLRPGGALFLDVYGGPDAQRQTVEPTRMHGFTYVWEQAPLDAVTHQGERHIHFRFSDGSVMKRAFSYDWRLWTLPELRDALLDAGFVKNDVYWEGADARGRGNGVFRRVERVDNEQAWVAYVVAWK
ncbi:MAG: class I SAM-dependent methyltransferase [Deltaproteobacteria bacterium]|nr:class I SAM-dependent methyltransferase [Deltaproteobacteria bacterium]